MIFSVDLPETDSFGSRHADEKEKKGSDSISCTSPHIVITAAIFNKINCVCHFKITEST